MKKKIILIMGLPGSGKTTIAKKIVNILKADWLNADKIRGKYNDWDFSRSGIIRQVKRMRDLAKSSNNKYVVADFVCPMHDQIKIFKPDFIFWMDTIKKSRFKSMNKQFKKPKKFDLRITSQNVELWKYLIIDKIIKYKWNNKSATSQMLGRYQPWHLGHRTLFENIFEKYGQVNIQVKDVNGLGDNPFTFNQIKKKIIKDLKDFKNRIKVTKSPNIVEINYGRTVGYKIKKINLSKKIQSISATKIRNKLRKKLSD
jgi:adenylate kinase family enzyme